MTQSLPIDPPPAQLGYAMPAEWQPHAATWLSWPHRMAEWPGKYEPIPWAFAEMIRLIAAGEQVHVFIPPGAATRRRITEILDRAGAALQNVTLIPRRTDRAWARDSGPIFVQRGGRKQTAILDWKFNAWAKYPESAYDDALPAFVAARLGLPRFVPMGRNDAGEYQRFVLEGGSIDVNGAGSVLTTEECLLSKIQQRNPGFARERVEQTLCDYLGAEQVLWLGRGIVGDDTHGHVDDLARFVAPDTIITTVERDRSDVNYDALRDNRQRLASFRNPAGKRFAIVELPTPRPVLFAGKRLPASYANFYICNAGVLVPVFNDPVDLAALKILEGCFPRRAILPIYARDLVLGRGTIHCLTQQQPA